MGYDAFHVLRHAIAPALCLQFASIGGVRWFIIGGEGFAYPGLGQALTVDAGLRGDIPY